MLRFLLDSDTAIALIRAHSAKTSAKFSSHAEELALSTVTAFELWYGADRSRDPQRNRRVVGEFLSLFSLIDFDLEAASHAAEIRAWLSEQGTPIGAYDLQIAAIARSRGLTVVTGNTREFSRVPGLRCDDWIERVVRP